jgi:hypothetical protein
MKRVGKIAVCLAGVVALNAGLRADSIVLPNNPYAPIVVRNVFDLNPVPKVDASIVDANPPPKITPNGIMDVFGHLQVLFKASDPATPGQTPKDNSYILGEGQRQDDIEVVKINEKGGIVTFNNHGTVQELPLASAAASSAPAAAMMNPNIPSAIPGSRPNGGNPFGSPGNFGGSTVNFGGRNRGGGNGGNNSNGGMGNGGNNPNINLNQGSTSTRVNLESQIPPGLTPEVQTIMIEANRMQSQQQGDPNAKLFPNTEMTPPPDSE